MASATSSKTSAAEPGTFFFDTSALLKLVVDEDGSDLAEAIWQLARRRTCSALAYPEGRAALAAAHRGGRLDETELRQAVASFDAVTGSTHRILPDQELLDAAGALAEEHALRGYDAVQLASALEVDAGTVLVSWDAELVAAAADRGLRAAPAG